MSHSFLKQAARDNWYLLAALGLIVAAIPVLAFWSDSRAESDPLRLTPTAEASTADLRFAELEPATATPSTLAEVRAREVIGDYRQRFKAEPNSDEAPALLSAMGNLYRQKLRDYGQAAGCFEQLISDYPDDPGVRDAYLQLMVCYDRLGDQTNRARVLRQMMDAYPADSQEHAYAAYQLGIAE